MRVAISVPAMAAMAAMAAIAACASKPAATAAEPDPPPVRAIDAGTPDAPGPDSGPAVSESEARVWLTAKMRDAGLRVRHDVAVTGANHAVVLDGWDPQRRIGFEYVAASAGDPPVPAEWRGAMEATGARVLIVEETDVRGLARASAAFVASLPRSE